MIDLRSDTVTQPCAGMRQAMANAAVGDDVIDVDPTTARLEVTIAELLGKECAMFMPSGTMTNQVAVRIHCQPGDEFLCEEGCHIYNYEQGGFAQLSALIPRTFRGQRSLIRLEEIREAIRPDNEHAVRTRLLCLENTHNRGGGVVLPLGHVTELCEWARQVDTVSVCLSKGLGAPVGSALAGPRSLLTAMRRARKLFGGGMRQSGILSAAALFALEHNIPRLAQDHAAAQSLADTVRQQCPRFLLEPEQVDTNIVIFRIDLRHTTAAQFCEAARELGVSLLPFSRQHVRAVTHWHITPEMIRQAGQVFVRLHDRFAKSDVSSDG